MQESTLFDELLKAIVASATMSSAAYGAAGGFTSGIAVTGMKRKDVVRHVALGAIMAACGGAGMYSILASWIGAEPIIAGTATGPASYITGVFGPAIIEVILTRIRSKLFVGGQND